MTKKFFTGMMMAASALFITSCASDDLTSSQAGGEATVSFSLALEDGLDTRAISDGSGADVLMYAVFDENGDRITGISKVEKTGVTFPTVENITLAKGQTYQIAFWAQDDDCEAYTVYDDMKVSIEYAGVNNDETRDAFYKTVEFTVTGSTSIDVVLKRPFAQINVGVYQEDWDAAVASGITITESTATIVNAAKSIDLLNGKVGEETTDVEVGYTAGAIPTESLMVDLDKDGTKEAYKWISMSYILVADHATTANADGIYGAAVTTLDDLGFSFIPAAGNTIDLSQGLKSVPVQRNWRTNIIGKILTGDIEFNISIDPIYDGDHNYEYGSYASVSSATELAAAFADEIVKDITVEGAVDNGGNMFSAYDKDPLVLNMNNYQVKAGGNGTKSYGFMFNSSDVTVNDANILGGGFGVLGGSSLVFNSGKVTANYSASGRYIFFVDGNSEVVVNDGVFEITRTSCYFAYASAGSKVTINGGTFTKAKANSASKDVPFITEGGVVEVKGGKFNVDPTNWLAAGYKAEKNSDGYWVVSAI